MVKDHWCTMSIQGKAKENGEVDKYKTCLVAKGCTQEFGMDHKEVFTLVARHDMIRSDW